jgi:hypothetical protein
MKAKKKTDKMLLMSLKEIKANLKKAAKMYIAGGKPGTICRQLYIKPDVFWVYVKKYQFDEAIELKINGVSDDIICKRLRLDFKDLKQNPLKVYFNEIEERRTQPGRTNWVTKICREYKN